MVNKIDAFDLEQRLGEPAVQERLRSSPQPVDIEALRSQVVRDQLVQWGRGDLVHQLEARCAKVRFFACSSLGHIPDNSHRAFEARGVLEPLLWTLASADSVFAAERPKRP